MERHQPLDIAGSAAIRGRVIRALALAFLVFVAVSPLSSQTTAAPEQAPAPESESTSTAKIKTLYSDQRWNDIVRAVPAVSTTDPDLDFYYGSALAQLRRLEDAYRALLTGYQIAPKDKRFPIELAGVSFKQKHNKTAATWLRRALRLDPADNYANDFLGTIYFLEGNGEAALKYWNKIDKPFIETVQPDHPLRIRPALLDRALAFSPESQLRLPNFKTSMARLEGLEVFTAPRILLAARPEAKFDVLLNLQERNGWGDSVWEALLSTFSGVAYQTIYPEYDNISGSAINITSLLRWDAQKRRYGVSLSGPLHQNPKWRYEIGVDLRNENWDIRSSFAGPAPLLGSLNLRREVASATITSFNRGSWGWSAGAEFSHRDYRSVIPGSAFTPEMLLQGPQLKQLTSIHYGLLDLPEHRFGLNSSASCQLGRIWSQPAHAFAKVQGSLQATWFPQFMGDDYEVQSHIRTGGASGQTPFDELYMLGMERDNDLWMRAHIGTRGGRKGSAPLGRNYFLANNEIDKNLYSNGLVALKVSPFLDTGNITRGSNALGSRNWLWDTGAQAKLRVLGVGVTFVYGKDLRTGNNAFYFMAGR
jgi:tetratricopeptide (TPR) repeat protein